MQEYISTRLQKLNRTGVEECTSKRIKGYTIYADECSLMYMNEDECR